MQAYSVIYLVIFSLGGLLHASLATEGEDYVDLTSPNAPRLPKYIEPFKTEYLATQDGPEEFRPIGNVKVIGTGLSKPFYFPITLTFYARGQNESSELRSVKVSLEHLQHTFHDPTAGIVKTKWYHYNLAKLMAPANPWDPNKRTIVIVPGYRSYENENWMLEIRDAWLQVEDVNVILVSWSKGNFVIYDTAAANVKIVARQITILFYYLFNVNNIDFYNVEYRKKIQFVGHSLGAHISGNVGHDLAGQVGRITGLDPAGPIFDALPPVEGLSTSSAILVDVIHTNAGVMRSVYLGVGAGIIKKTATSMFNLISPLDGLSNSTQSLPEAADGTSNTKTVATPWFGIQHPIGHVDYYANGGSLQPGCNLDKLHLCDHSRAKYLYLFALRRQLGAQKKFKPDGFVMRRKLYRPMAFKARSHRDYRTGSSIQRYCPKLISAMDLQLSDYQRYKALTNCMIPIDFVAHGPDFRRELIEVYRLKLPGNEHDNEVPNEALDSTEDDEENEQEDTEDKENEDGEKKQQEDERKQQQDAKQKQQVDDDDNGYKFYFDTINEQPYITEHHLLRLHMPDPVKEGKVLWNPGCRLTAKMNAKGKERYTLADYDGESLTPIKDEQGRFHGLVLPFANPTYWQQRPIDFRTTEEDVYGNHINAVFVQVLHYFVDSMEFQMSHTSGSLKKAFESLSSLLWKPKASLSNRCLVQFEAVEIVPFDALYNNISVWMKNDVDWEKSPVYEYDVNTVKDRNSRVFDIKSYQTSNNKFFVNSITMGQQTEID